MQSRLAIVLMSVAGTAALFAVGFLLGLGVMSTSKPEHHKEIALTTTPTKVARAETTGRGKGDDRALTPLTPVAPGGAAAKAATPEPAPQQSQPQPQQTASVAPAETAPQQAPQPAPKAEMKDQPEPQNAKAEPASAPAPTANAEPASTAPEHGANATPVSLSSRNACDVSACSRAYRSFRESDCTYQPYSGPRQVCVSPPGANEAARGRDTRQASRSDDEPAGGGRVRRAGRGDDLDSVVHEVERMTDGRRSSDDERPMARRYHRDFTADGEDDRVVPADADRGGFDDEDDDQ